MIILSGPHGPSKKGEEGAKELWTIDQDAFLYHLFTWDRRDSGKVHYRGDMGSMNFFDLRRRPWPSQAHATAKLSRGWGCAIRIPEKPENEKKRADVLGVVLRHGVRAVILSGNLHYDWIQNA
jgi:hypothetical protein